MKSFIIILSALIMSFCTTSCAMPKTIDASNKYTTKEFKIDNFSKLKSIGSFDVIYAIGSPKVRIVAPDNVISYLKISVDAGELNIQQENNVNFKFKEKGGVKIYVWGNNLNAANLIGSGSINIDTELNVPQDFTAALTGSGDIVFKDIKAGGSINLNLSGSGDIDVTRLESKKATLQLSGSGDIKVSDIEAEDVTAGLSGSGDTKIGKINVNNVCKLSISGSGDFDVKSVRCNRLIAMNTGSCDMEIKGISTLHIEANSSGSGDLELKGVADHASLKANGTCDIDAKDLLCQTVDAECYQDAEIKVNATKQLNCAIYQNSDIYYYGSPSVKCNTSKKPKARN